MHNCKEELIYEYQISIQAKRNVIMNYCNIHSSLDAYSLTVFSCGHSTDIRMLVGSNFGVKRVIKVKRHEERTLSSQRLLKICSETF